MLSCAFSSTSVTLMSTKPEDRSSRTAQSHHSGERVDGDLELGEAQHDVQLGYRLPALVESMKQSWQSTCESAAVVSSLSAATASQLLGNVQASIGHVDPVLANLVLFASYACILFNASATISSLLLIDTLGDLPLLSSRRMPEGEYVPWGNVLRRFGADRSWNWIVIHWLSSLLLGIFCLFAQVLIYVWIQSPETVRFAVTIAGVYSFLPILLFFPYKMYTRRNRVTKQTIEPCHKSL